MGRYTEIIQRQQREQQERLSRSAALTAPPVPPDTMSEALRIAERRGVPAGAVVQDLPRYKQLDELDAVQAAATAHPALGSWLIDPTNVALSKDELPQVSKLANSIAQTKTTQDRPYDWGPWGWGQLARDVAGSFGSRLVSTFGSALEGQADLRGSVQRTLDRATTSVAGDGIGAFMRDPFNQRGGRGVDLTQDGLRTSGQAIENAVAFTPRQQSTVTDVAGGLGTLGAQVTTFALTRGAGTTALNLGLGANQGADMAREAGAEGTAGADVAVLASAPVAAALERVGLNALLNRAPPVVKGQVARWVTDKLIAGGIEGTQEAAEQVVYNALAQQLYNPDQSLTEGLPQNFEVGAWVGALARAATGARFARTQAEREGELLDAITKDAGATLLRERNPAKFRELAEKLAASGADRVYLDGAEAAAYFQSAGLDPSQFMDADALTDAAVAGTDVAIPMEDWITRVAPEHGEALSKFARLTPSGMSRADLEQFNERAEAEFQAFLDAVPQDTMGPDTSQQVYDDVLGQLLGTGMNRQAAEANAELHRRFWQTQAQRSGKSAMELYQPYGLRIQREDPAGMAILRERPNADAAVDSLLGRLVTGDIPTEAQAMGPSLVEWLAGQGGVNDPAMAGELRRLNESDRVNRRGKPKLVTKLGRSLDQARELAVEAGYLPEGADLNALLDAITQEVDGGPAIRVGGDQVLADQRNMLIQAGDLLNEAGVDPADRDAARRFLLGDEEAVQRERAFSDPPVPEGMTRVWHGGRAETYDADTVVDATNIRRRAEGYATGVARGEGGEAGRLYYLDLPDNDPRIAQDYPGEQFDPKDLRLTPEEVAQLRPSVGETTFYQDALPEQDEVAALKARIASLEKELRTDELTGLRNRRAFNEDEALGWEGVMAFDMDGLTALNAMGHEVGDAALKAIGEVMLASETDTARFYHTSGDEFYGRATTMAEAQELAQMIQDKLESVDLDIVMAGADGQTRDFTYRGIGVSRGAGATPNEADQVAIRNKAEREASGVRQAKGDTGPLRRLVDRRAEGNRDRRQRVDSQQEGNAQASEDGLTEFNQSAQTETPEFRRWFGDSKVVDADGRPLVVYHGTKSDVESFDLSRAGASDPGLVGKAIYFTPSPEQASSFAESGLYGRGDAPNVIPAFVSLQNPAVIMDGVLPDGRRLSEAHPGGLTPKSGSALQKSLKRAGYDGAIFRIGDEISQVVAFRPEQIKSATANVGTFDPNNPSILAQDDAATESIRRGWINFANRASVQIGLTPKADLSTFIHESGHFFLEVMGDLARDPNAPQDIVDDYAAIVRFLGVSSREEIGREQHEKLARAFESYLGEGKAPVPELAGVMARMRAWMLQVYKTLRALDVELNDEIRGVFDRMLVGDAAVSRAESAANMEPLFREAAAAGMSEARFREYLKQQQAGHDEAMARISARAVREVQREQEAWWKAARADMLEEVKAETYALPVYQAWANLARGTQPDGSPLPEGMASMKLDKEWLVARYGQQYLNDNLRFKRVYAAQGTNGDVVAGQFGFPNGDALVTALVNAPPMQAYIQATTDARMAEKYGDMRTDPAMAEKAMQIAHNDRRMAAIAGDVAVLEGLAGAPALDRATVKAWARQKIAGTQLRDVVPFVYLRSERKHAREAQRLAAAGKYAEALVEARQRLANAMLYDEATKAKDLAERVDKRLTKLAKKSAQTRLAKAGGDWLQLTNSILAALGRYDFGPNRGPLNMAQWIDKHVEAENENPIPASVELLVDSQQTTELKRLTIQQIRDVRTAVMNIDTQAAAVAKVMANDKAVEWEAARDALTGRLEETQATGPSAFTEAEKSTADRIMDGIKGFADVLLSPQTIIERLDGGEQGPWHDLFWNIAARARDARDVMRESTLKPLFNMMEGWDKAKRQRIMMDTVRMESLGGVELKRQTLISMALNMGTDSSLKKLMGGGRWVNGQHVEFTQPVIDEVVTKLTREDWDIVQAVWNASASLKKPTEELQKRLGGIIPRDLATRTIETPFGTIQGQYFPLIGDPTQSSVGEKQQATATVQQIIGPTARATTSKSRLQERTGVMYPLELNLETLLLGRVDEVITDITHREFLLQANKILDDGKLRNLLRTRAGDTAYQSLRGAVARAVGDRIYGDPAMRYPNKLMDAATTNLSVMALGFRYLLGLGNYVAAWPQAVSRVGVKHLVSAFSRTLGPGQFQAAQTFVYRLSPYMANRNGDFDRQFQQALRSMAGKQSLRRDVARFAMAYQQTADRLAVVPIWMARFEQAIAAGESQAAAVRLADTAIQQTQTDHSAIGLSAFEGDKSFRLFKLFIGPMIIQQNRIRDALAGKGYSRSQSIPERMGVLLAAWVVPALLFDLLLLRFPEDDDDDGLDVGDWTKWGLTKTAMYPLMTVPFIRDGASVLEAKILGKPVFARNNPVSDAAATIAKAGTDTTEQVLDRVQEGEEIDGERMFRNWFKAAGVGIGVPTAAATPPGEFIYDVAMNEYQPEGVQDLRYLFVRREDR